MEREEITTAVLKYQPLSYNERILLEKWFFDERRAQGYRRVIKIPFAEWAERLGRCARTVRNELRRGACPHMDSDLLPYTAYSAKVAQDDADMKALNKGAPRKMDTDADYGRGVAMLAALVRKNRFRKDIREDEMRYSVYAAAEVVNAAIPGAGLKPRNIYSLIHKGLIEGLGAEDALFFRYRPRKKAKDPPPVRADKLGRQLADRPPSALDRLTCGHWEGDTVHSGRGSRVVFFSFIERKTRFQVVVRCQDGSARAARRALRKLMRLAGEVLSITFDNGVEFSDIEGMERILQDRYAEALRVYFAAPFRSCDRATNENNHRFLRRFVPKGSDLGSVSSER
ncbi:MAG: IS30 family transposase, partial [Synergistales bacterium]|nr:IS30 family transposase [Synergistales bacterium]